MRGKKARALRKVVYQDNAYDTEYARNKTSGSIETTGLRRFYQMLKRNYNDPARIGT